MLGKLLTCLVFGFFSWDRLTRGMESTCDGRERDPHGVCQWLASLVVSSITLVPILVTAEPRAQPMSSLYLGKVGLLPRAPGQFSGWLRYFHQHAPPACSVNLREDETGGALFGALT